MDKAALELTRESFRMKGRYPFGKTAGKRSVVYFVDPELLLNFVDELNKFVTVNGVV